MRVFTLLAFIVIIGCQANSGSPGPTAQPVAKVLGIGDPAPPFAVSKWLHGSPVTLQPGTAYVIDFWAIWCGPCKAAMPHLDSLAKQYAGKGVEFIAVTSPDSQGNTLDRVAKFVEETGSKYSIHFAWCDNDSLFALWMDAARRDGIPCSFVVDKTGKIAFIGHPQEVDDVLPRVVAGTWRGKDDLDAIAASNRKLEEIFDRVHRAGLGAVERLESNATDDAKIAAFEAAAAKVSQTALDELAAFEKDHPQKMKQPNVIAQRMVLSMRVGQFDAAKAMAEEVMSKSRPSQDVEQVDRIRQCWLSKSYNPDRKHLGVATTAADLILELRGETDLIAAVAAAEAYKAAGNKEKFDAFAARARALTATDAERRKKVEEALKSFQ